MSAILKYDTGPLNWVRNDIEAALQAALGRVQAFTADSDLTNALRLARDDAHQVMGALRMVGLEGAATVASALEMTLADINEGRQSPGDDVFRAIRNTIEGLSRWIKELAEGRGTGELALFPLYRRLRELQGAERVFEGELFFPDLRSRVQGIPRAIEQSNDALSAQIKTTRSMFQRGLLAFLRGQNGKQGLQQMRQALAEVEKVAPSQAAQTFWWACVGFIDSLIAQGVEADFYVKQLLARIDLQMRRLMEGSPQVAERLLRDALFFVAKSQTLEGRAAEVRATFSLDQYLPGKGLLDPETLARMRPVLAALKTCLKNARDIWHAHVESAATGQVENFQAQLARMRDQAELVGADALPALMTQLSDAAGASARFSGEPQEQMNLEIAATLLFLQNAVESEEILRTDFTARAHSQGKRLLALAEGRALPQAEALLDTQSQAVAERELLHHLAQEVTSNLKQIEDALDLFFRDAGQREGLAQLPSIAGQARGALVMLELHDAADLLGAAVKAVEQYTVEGYPVDDDKDRIADAFSSLGLYIEAHCAGRADAGRILQPVMAGFGLACADAGPEAVADDSIEAGLDARKAGVASAYLDWRDEGGEEASKKFLEILIELGRDAELIDDGALKHGVEALLAAGRAVMTPGIELDDQVSQLTHTTLPARIQPAELTPHTELDAESANDDDLNFDLPSFDMPEVSSLIDETALLESSDLLAQQAPATPVDVPSGAKTVMAVMPSDSDAELLEIFLEEAGEVLTTMSDACETCRSQPDDRESLTTIRRGFHTLKGSGRMVGLSDLGEAAWGMEQFMNTWLAENKPASTPCLDMIDASRQFFQEWVNALVANEPVALPVAALLAATEPVAKGLAYPGLKTSADVAAEIIAPLPAKPENEVVDTSVGSLLLSFDSTSDDEAIVESETFASIDETRDEAEAVYPQLSDSGAESPDEVLQAAPAAEIADELIVGDVHLSLGLFDIFMVEAQQRVASLQDEMLRLSETDAGTISETAQRAIHTLSGIAGTAGFSPLASLAHALEMYWNRFEFTPMPATHHALVNDIVQRMQEMLVQISTHSAPHPGNDLIAALGELEDERAINVAPFVHQDDPVELLAVDAEVIAPETLAEVPLPEIQCVAQIEYASPAVEVEPEVEITEAASAVPEEIDPEYCAVEFHAAVSAPALAEESALVEEDAVAELAEKSAEESSFADQDAVAEHDEQTSQAPAEQVPVKSEPVEAFVPAPAIEAPAPDRNVTLGSGKLDLTDLVPDAPQKVVAPVFERRNVADEIDQELLPIFMEEAEALIPETSEQLRLWKTQPKNQSALNILRRNLHTLKGSARMVGAMRLGELTHVMESRIIAIGDGEVEAAAADFDALEAQMDRLAHTVENLKRGELSEPEAPVEDSPTELADSPSAEKAMPASDQAAAAAQPVLRDAQALTLRVRADWVDRMVNQAGEVAIARSRIESEVFNFKRHVGELSEALVRLRGHIREVEIQAESQMQSTFITQGQGEHFDPLEFDRFTRFQEVTRFLAESVNDISTVHHILMARLGEADAALLHQTRLNRELQQNLLRVRMVPMYSVAERLYRTVRQTARDVDKRAQLDIQGGDLEIDRSVLEKVTAPLEHLLRNALAHGIESPEIRKSAGKTEFGEITLSAQQSGNEMLLVVKDDGAGLNFERIREKALAQGMLTPGIEPSEAQLAQMIFAAGFSTAEKVSEVSGRGVGMDVVKSEIAGLGGRIDISSNPGKGTQFSIYLPLTLAMTQAVMFSAGKQDYALPTTLVQQVLELKPEPLAKALAAGEIEWRGVRYPLTYLPHLLGNTEAVHEVQIFNRIVLLKSGNSVAAVLVDSIEGTREIVVKNIGPQLARVTGIAGATVRGDGRVILILNPVPLALRWMSQPKETREHIAAHVLDAPEIQLAPLVLVVDDSLTVRKITGRLLTREGYRMDTAKDGVDALEKMHDMIPDVVLLDVEMPRMDGFELARVMRNDARLKQVPIIMITSRTAEKHRNHALELGVNLYMGKPYQEQQLLEGIASLVTKNVTA